MDRILGPYERSTCDRPRKKVSFQKRIKIPMLPESRLLRNRPDKV
jgi:hypothetical protein